MEGEVRHRGEELLPDNKGGDEDDSEDDHGDDVTASPAIGGLGGEVEGKQEKRPAKGGEAETDDCTKLEIVKMIGFEVKHTIKLHKMVLDRLPHGTVVNLFRGKTQLLSLNLAHDKDDHDGNAKGKQNNAKSTKSPSKVDIDVEQFSNLGASKRRRDGRRIVKTHNDQSVSKSRGISNNNIDNIDKTKMANPVKSVRSGVHFDVLAGGLHDHADDDEENHGAKAPDSSPDVNDLCDGKGADAAEDGGDDACCCD